MVMSLLWSCAEPKKQEKSKKPIRYSHVRDIPKFYNRWFDFTPLEKENISQNSFEVSTELYGKIKVWLDSNSVNKYEKTNYHSDKPPHYLVRIIRDIVTGEKYYLEDDKRREWLYNTSDSLIFYKPALTYDVRVANGVFYDGNATYCFIYNPRVKKATYINVNYTHEFPKKKYYPIKNGLVVMGQRKIHLYRFKWN